MSTERQVPDVSQHVTLMDRLIDGQISAKEFQLQYQRVFLDDPRMHEDWLYDPLNEAFYAAEDYVDEPHLRTEPEDNDEEALRQRVGAARDKLAALGIRSDSN